MGNWIEFSFDPADVRTNASVDNEFVAELSKPQNVEKIIKDNLDKIQKEIDVASKGYSTLNLQDRSIGYKAHKLLRLSMRIRGRSLGYDNMGEPSLCCSNFGPNFYLFTYTRHSSVFLNFL